MSLPSIASAYALFRVRPETVMGAPTPAVPTPRAKPEPAPEPKPHSYLDCGWCASDHIAVQSCKCDGPCGVPRCPVDADAYDPWDLQPVPVFRTPPTTHLTDPTPKDPT